MNRFVLLLVIVFSVLVEIECKTFSQCDLAQMMHKHYGFSKESLGDWMCLVKHESNFKTTAINPHNPDGSTDYGLFQINSRYWCGQKHPGGECHVLCKSLLDSDITDDIKCIKKIYKRHGFSGWAGWKAHCKGKHLPNMNKCF